MNSIINYHCFQMRTKTEGVDENGDEDSNFTITIAAHVAHHKRSAHYKALPSETSVRSEIWNNLSLRLYKILVLLLCTGKRKDHKNITVGFVLNGFGSKEKIHKHNEIKCYTNELVELIYPK